MQNYCYYYHHHYHYYYYHNRNFGDIKLFHVDLNRRNCPSARCASAANAISRNTCICNGRSVLINDLLLV
jgi:hypothetical protein